MFAAVAVGTGGTVEDPTRLRRFRTMLGLGQQPLEPGVLLLQLLQALGVLGLQAPELVAPPKVRLLADTQLPGNLGDIGALREQPISLGQLPNDLLGRVPLPSRRRHDVSLPAHPRGPQELSHHPDRRTGHATITTGSALYTGAHR
jgi:hypothetical protein